MFRIFCCTVENSVLNFLLIIIKSFVFLLTIIYCKNSVLHHRRTVVWLLQPMFMIISMCDIFQPDYYSNFTYHVRQLKCLQLPIIDLWLYTSHNYIPIFSTYYANMEWCTLLFHYINFNMKNIYQHFLSCKT